VSSALFSCRPITDVYSPSLIVLEDEDASAFYHEQGVLAGESGEEAVADAEGLDRARWVTRGSDS